MCEFGISVFRPYLGAGIHCHITCFVEMINGFTLYWVLLYRSELEYEHGLAVLV
jgi:outer membrane protein W